MSVTGTSLGGTVTLDGQLVPGATAFAGGIAFDTPPHEPGSVTIGLSNGIGQATRPYTYLPAVKGVSPPSGPPSGGTPLTITGKGLATATEVEIGGKVAAVISKADGEVRVAAPAHEPGKVPVTVRTEKGVSVPATPGADQFEYVASTVPLETARGPAGAGGAGNEGGGSSEGRTQPPLGGGGSGGGTAEGGLTVNNPVASTGVTPDPAGSSLAGGGLTTSVTPEPAGGSLAGGGLATTSPAPATAAAPTPSSPVTEALPAAGPSAAPVAPPAPATAPPVAQGGAGTSGVGLPGGGGDNTTGAPVTPWWCSGHRTMTQRWPSPAASC